MFLLHPPLAPWRVRRAAGCDVVLLIGNATGDAEPDAVWLRSLSDNEELLLPMRAAGYCGALQRWCALLPWDGGNPCTRYAFKVQDAARQHWLAADGAHRHQPPEDLHFRVHPSERPPDWVRDQVFYQIFPDRFAQGAPAADRRGEMLPGLPPRPVLQPAWGTPIDAAQAANSYYGGDLSGILQHLPYLQDELGVTALYLNPVFAAGSNHRYDTESFDEVDPHLGGNAALAALAGALRTRGMRWLLDAVVNHTGRNHPWFNRWGHHPGLGAAQSADSPWRELYAFDDRGEPIGWKGHASLPVLDFSSPLLRDLVYAAPDAILRRWLRAPYAADGWRLDVIHMLGEGPGAANNALYVREFRRAMREENPEAYVLGEHFSEATRWLQGDQEDGAMNYHGFAHPLRAWLAGIDINHHPIELATADFERWLAQARAGIPWDNQLAQLNLLDSHDTTRFLTLLGGDLARMRVAVTLLFTAPGVPCIYYGDEIGLEGGPDPDCRRCFDWERSHWNQPLFERYRQLARLRRERAEWRHGAWQTLALGPDWLAFARYTEGAATAVAVNRGAAVKVSLPLNALPLDGDRLARWVEADGQAFEAGPATLSFMLPERGALVLMSS